MSESVQKNKCNLEPECITIDSDSEDDEEDGYVKIRYQQPDLPALEIPIDDKGDLPWKLVQALDSKIIGLSVRSKEKRRIMKIKNGVIQEPKKGWKAFKVIALLEKPKESIAKDAVRSTASSCCCLSPVNEVEIEKENVPAKDFAYSTNLSTPSPTTSLLPELACLAKPVNYESNNENSFPENSVSVQSTVVNDLSVANHIPPLDEGSSNKEHPISENSHSFQSIGDDDRSSVYHRLLMDDDYNYDDSNFENSWLVHYPSSITNDLFTAYKVKSFYEYRNLLKIQYGISSKFCYILCRFLRNALVVHADKNVISLLSIAAKSRILYNEVDPTASDICLLCEKSLTIRHLLKKKHLNEYYLKYHQGIPEIDNIVHYFYSNSSDKKSGIPIGFSTNTFSSQQLFDEYKEAFLYRISQQNLKIPIDDPLFLDRFLYMRKNLERYSLPESLKPNFGDCLPCEKSQKTFHAFISHTLSIIHIKNALTQEDLDWCCKMFAFIQDDENGYKIKLPLLKRKADDEKNEDTVVKKRSKKI